jgi:thymidylate kinase
MLLALEGISGSGKSTLRDWLLSAAAHKGIQAGHIGQFSWLSLPSTRALIALRAGRPASTADQALAAARRDLELHARHNLAPALMSGPVIADRLLLSTAVLLALVHDGPVERYVRQLAEVSAARPDVTVLLTTPPEVCHRRLEDRATARRFGETQATATRLTFLYGQAATAWTAETGLPVLQHPCVDSDDLQLLSAECLAQLLAASGAMK